MKQLFLTTVFSTILALTATAQINAPNIDFSLDNPVVKTVIKKALNVYIPKVTGKNEKVKDVTFVTKNETNEFQEVKGTVTFQNPAAALGNGSYRVKLKVGKNLLNPKLYYLKLQVLRIWFIRFYRKVI